jgi:type I restriction enzyme S subunit
MAKPTIRFKGYTEDWEQRKLGELVIDHNAGIYISKEDYGEGTNVIGVGNIYDRDIFDGEIYRLGPVNDDKFILEENDILYGESSLVPEGIARTVCVGKNGAGSAFAWHTRRVKLDKNIVNSHVATLELNYLHDIRKYLVSVSTQTALTGMTTEGYFGATLTLPSVEEQQKISDYFKNLDNLITLHQRKCEETKILKKYMLQKMFPQNGQKVPEIRFKGFTEDWEQRKFGELGSVTMCKRIFKEQTSPVGDIPFYKIGTFGAEPDAFISRELFEEYKEKFQYPKIGDMLISASGTIGRTVEYDGEEAYFQDSNIVWFKHDERVDNSFLKCIYGIIKWSGIEGSTIKRLYNDNFLKTEFYMPLVAEQEKIGEYFANLDHLITLHQRKYEELKNIKKFMLQNMFV